MGCLSRSVGPDGKGSQYDCVVKYARVPCTFWARPRILVKRSELGVVPIPQIEKLLPEKKMIRE